MEEIDLKELFNVLVKKMYIIVLTTIFCALLGFIYSKFIVTPMYNSSTSFVLSKSENGQNTSITQNDLTLNSKLVSTYGAIIKSKTIASSVGSSSIFVTIYALRLLPLLGYLSTILLPTFFISAS